MRCLQFRKSYTELGYCKWEWRKRKFSGDGRGGVGNLNFFDQSYHEPPPPEHCYQTFYY